LERSGSYHNLISCLLNTRTYILRGLGSYASVSRLLHANWKMFTAKMEKYTFVPDHPSLKAASWAKSSPKPSIRPFTNGNSRLIVAPRNRPHIVGGEYKIRGELEEDGGEGESSLFADE